MGWIDVNQLSRLGDKVLFDAERCDAGEVKRPTTQSIRASGCRSSTDPMTSWSFAEYGIAVGLGWIGDRLPPVSASFPLLRCGVAGVFRPEIETAHNRARDLQTYHNLLIMMRILQSLELRCCDAATSKLKELGPGVKGSGSRLVLRSNESNCARRYQDACSLVSARRLKIQDELASKPS